MRAWHLCEGFNKNNLHNSKWGIGKLKLMKFKYFIIEIRKYKCTGLYVCLCMWMSPILYTDNIQYIPIVSKEIYIIHTVSKCWYKQNTMQHTV